MPANRIARYYGMESPPAAREASELPASGFIALPPMSGASSLNPMPDVYRIALEAARKESDRRFIELMRSIME
ncbi:hypothetical protein [Planctomicrobium sp. SH664]|uniref:hypothetical protein n=1 Tax=Planctomicrobium sp. SH664 TaxID=3448125 RepID=UPI003F5C26A9